jgi:hypothetical protein
MQDMSDLRKSIAERLGSAAKFTMSAAKYRAFVYRGSPRSNVLVKATEWMDSAIAAEEAAKQIAMSFRGQPGYNSDNYFADIAQETPMGAKTVKNNVRFSRPGAKAKMAADPALASFLKKWKRNEADNYHSENVVMLAKFVGASGDVAEANRIMQQHDEIGYLTPELNSKRYALYTALKAKLLAKYPGVTFSRPGAKAKMGKDIRELNTYLSSLIRQRDMLVSDDRRAKGKDLRVANHLNRIRQEIDAVLMDIARAEKATASRPGAKAKMRQTLQAMHDGLQWKVVIPSGAAWYSDDGKQWTKKHGEPVPSSEVKQYEIKLGTGFARPGAKGSSKAKA